MSWRLHSVNSEYARLMGNRSKASAGHCEGSPTLPFPQSEIFLRTMLATDRFKAPQVLPVVCIAVTLSSKQWGSSDG